MSRRALISPGVDRALEEVIARFQKRRRAGQPFGKAALEAANDVVQARAGVRPFRSPPALTDGRRVGENRHSSVFSGDPCRPQHRPNVWRSTTSTKADAASRYRARASRKTSADNTELHDELAEIARLKTFIDGGA